LQESGQNFEVTIYDGMGQLIEASNPDFKKGAGYCSE
jgi:hypothetical protein